MSETKFLESTENLKPLVRKRFGREPSSSTAREITACLQQGRLFYEAAASSPLEIRPLQMFYGMVGFAKALVVARKLQRLSTLRHGHGLKDISKENSRIAELRLRIVGGGTFQEFNDVVSELNRIGYTDYSTQRRAIPVPATKSDQLCGLELSLKDVLSRIPTLNLLYQLTFGQDANTAPIDLETGRLVDDFSIRIYDPQLFTDRDSLKEIVDRWRLKFPFLRKWRLSSASVAWGKSIILFSNVPQDGPDEFSETLLLPLLNGEFQAIPGSTNERFPLVEGLSPVAGGYSAVPYAIAPIGGCYVSEFSLQYLALFLLSSLVRYRPQTWVHAISRSVTADDPADDQALSLIERFLDVNSREIPSMIAQVLNPHEDYFYTGA